MAWFVLCLPINMICGPVGKWWYSQFMAVWWGKCWSFLGNYIFYLKTNSSTHGFMMIYEWISHDQSEAHWSKQTGLSGLSGHQNDRAGSFRLKSTVPKREPVERKSKYFPHVSTATVCVIFRQMPCHSPNEYHLWLCRFIIRSSLIMFIVDSTLYKHYIIIILNGY